MKAALYAFGAAAFATAQFWCAAATRPETRTPPPATLQRLIVVRGTDVAIAQATGDTFGAPRGVPLRRPSEAASLARSPVWRNRAS